MSSTRTPHDAPVLPTPSTNERTRRPGRPTPGAARGAVPPARGVLAASLGVTLVSLAGSLLAVGTGLSASWWDAVGPTGRLSVPLPMNLALLVLALAAAGTRRRLAVAAAGLLTLACTAAVASGFFDGGYAAALSPVERVAQVTLVLGLTGLAVLSGRRVVHVLRG